MLILFTQTLYPILTIFGRPSHEAKQSLEIWKLKKINPIPHNNAPRPT